MPLGPPFGPSGSALVPWAPCAAECGSLSVLSIFCSVSCRNPLQSKERCRLNTSTRVHGISEEAAKLRGTGGPSVRVSRTPGGGRERSGRGGLRSADRLSRVDLQSEGEPRPRQEFSMDLERPGCDIWEQGGRCDWRRPTAAGIEGRSCRELTRASTLGAVGMRGQKGGVEDHNWTFPQVWGMYFVCADSIKAPSLPLLGKHLLSCFCMCGALVY